MADEPKLQVFKATGKDGNIYEIHAPDFNTALKQAEEYATANNAELSFEAPADYKEPAAPKQIPDWIQLQRAQSEAQIPDWMKLQRAQNEAAMSENMSGGVFGPGLGKLALQAPKLVGGYLAANYADSDTPAQNTGNRFLRDVARTAPAVATGGVAGGAGNFLLGRLFDKISGETHAQPPGAGEVSSEVLGGLIPGLNMVKGRGPQMLQKLAGLAEKNPITASTAVGTGAGALAAQGRNSPTEEGAVTGFLGGLGSGILGKVGKRLLQALPTIERSKVLEELRGLGINLTTKDADTDTIQDIAGKMKRPAAALELAEKQQVDLPGEIKETAAKINNARTLDSMQARNKSNAAFKVLANTAEEESLNTLRLARARSMAAREVKSLEEKLAESKAVGGARQAQELKLSKAKENLFILDEGMRRNKTIAKLNERGPRQALISAEEYEKTLRQGRLRSKFELREAENMRVASNEVYDKVAGEGFDFRNLGPNEKSAIKILAVDNPGDITKRMIADPSAAETASRGIRSLFGEKSPEFAAVKNRFGHDMIDFATDKSTARFGSGPISGRKLGRFLEKFSPGTIDNIYGPGAHQKLLIMSEMLSTSENIRTPQMKLMLTPYAISTAAGALYGGSEHAVPYGAVGLVVAGVGHMLWKSVPALLDDAVNKGTKLGKVLDSYAKTKTPGAGLSRAIPKVVRAASDELPPTQEQTPSAPR